MIPILLSLIIATSSLPTDRPYVQMISDDAVQTLPWSQDNILKAIDFYSQVYGVSSTTMRQIVHDESGFNQYAKGDFSKGAPTSFGLVQIHAPAHKDISISQMYSPFFALNYLASQLKAGNCKLWSTCKEDDLE
jgi:hypothetical protein